MFHQSKSYKICWLICVILFVVGIFLMDEDQTEYSVNEYWVAQNYHHVYEKYSGEIVNVIEKDETCKIKDKYIVVSRKRCGEVGYNIGVWLTILFGIGMAYLTFIFFKEAWYDQRK